MEVSCSSTLVLVDLYAPVIVCKHFLWIDLRGFTILSGILLILILLFYVIGTRVRHGP